jgi:hypothetical protein
MRFLIKSAASAVFAASVVATAALVSFAPAANAYSFVTSGEATQSSLGAAGSYINSPWDQLTVEPGSGNFQLGSITLNKVTFGVGINADVPNPNLQGWINETITVIGLFGATSLDIPFNLDINYSDTLTILGGTTLYLPGFTLVVDSLYFPAVGTGGSWSDYLTAQVYASSSPLAVANTPLPSTWTMLIAGFAGLGYFAYRGSKKSSSALAAA